MQSPSPSMTPASVAECHERYNQYVLSPGSNLPEAIRWLQNCIEYARQRELGAVGVRKCGSCG